MKRLTFAVLVAALMWSGYWVWASQARKAAVQDWFAARQAQGWEASYADLTVRGFPNRLDITLDQPRLVDPQSGIAWQSPFLQVFELVYNPGHTIIVFADSQHLTLDGQVFRIDSDGLRASTVLSDGALQRANVEATYVNVQGDGASLALAGLTAGLGLLSPEQARYGFGLAASSVVGADRTAIPGPEQIDAVSLQAEIDFDGPWNEQSLIGPRPQPTQIILQRAGFTSEGLELNLAGDLDVDNSGRADGALALRAVNWRETLDRAGNSGALPQGLVTTLEQGLGLLSQLSGNRDTLDLTVTFRDGQMAVGLIPLGPAPRIRMP